MADLVLNHRVGTANWTDFTQPAWSCESICIDDEAVSDPNAFGTTPCGALDEGEAWHGARDLNHKSEEVQNGIINYLAQLKALGFDFGAMTLLRATCKIRRHLQSGTSLLLQRRRILGW